MTTKILTENGQVLHRSTCRPLTSDKLSYRDGSDAWDQFMGRVYDRLGSWGLENNPQHDLCEDETQNQQMFPQLAEELEPTSHCGWAFSNLCRGDTFFTFSTDTKFFSEISVFLKLRSVCCLFWLCGIKIYQNQFLLMLKSLFTVDWSRNLRNFVA